MKPINFDALKACLHGHSILNLNTLSPSRIFVLATLLFNRSDSLLQVNFSSGESHDAENAATATVGNKSNGTTTQSFFDLLAESAPTISGYVLTFFTVGIHW